LRVTHFISSHKIGGRGEKFVGGFAKQPLGRAEL
jgi:hypothetical protein